MLGSNKRSIMTLYSESSDYYSHQVRMVLAEKCVTFDVVNVDQTPTAQEELVQYNPYGSIPTLVDRDLVLYQAPIIMEYLDERFPHPPLMPVYPVARGRTRLMMHRIYCDWYSLLDKITLNDSTKDKAELLQELKESIMSVIPVFAEMPFFMSEEFSLIDCCIAPILWRLPSIGLELPSQAQAIIDYASKIFERDSFQASLTEVERGMRLDEQIA